MLIKESFFEGWRRKSASLLNVPLEASWEERKGFNILQVMQIAALKPWFQLRSVDIFWEIFSLFQKRGHLQSFFQRRGCLQRRSEWASGRPQCNLQVNFEFPEILVKQGGKMEFWGQLKFWISIHIKSYPGVKKGYVHCHIGVQVQHLSFMLDKLSSNLCQLQTCWSWR